MTKKNPALGDLITCMIAMLVMFIVLYMGVDMYSQLSLSIKKQRLERTYLFAMETEGCLSAEKMAELTAELTDMGVSNISLSGTTTSPAGYGNYVYLCVSGKLKVSGIRGLSLDGWSWIKGETEIDFRINQKTTAKY